MKFDKFLTRVEGISQLTANGNPDTKKGQEQKKEEREDSV